MDARTLRGLAPLLVLALSCGDDHGGSSSHGGHEGHGHAAEGKHHGGGEGGAPPEDEGGGRHGEGAPPDHIELSPEAVESIGVRTGAARSGELAGQVTAPATVEPDVERIAHVAPLVEGQIVRLPVSLGDEVKAGETVAVIHSVALGEARAELAEARAELDVAQTEHERQKKLHDEGIAAERAFVQARGRLRQAEARHDAAVARVRTFGVRGGSGPSYPLKSKIDGVVIEQHAAMGETKQPSDALFVVADLSRVWVIGRVYERDVRHVRRGMAAVVELDAYPSRTWKGEVDWIASTVDEETRNLPIRVELDNDEGRLRPGLFGSIVLEPADTAAGLAVVPADAVQQLGGTDVVFAPTDDEHRFRVIPVRVGEERDELVEISSGIEPDDEIVTKGAFDLKSAATASGRSAAHHH